MSSPEGVDAKSPPVVARPLFVLDYDGTLAPIVDDPEVAFPHPDVPGLLAELTGMAPVLVVTGRRAADLARFLPVPGLRVAGVHGSERAQFDRSGNLPASAAGAAPGLREQLPALPDIPGIRVEDKVSALAIHYRGVSDEASVVERLRDWSGSVPDDMEVMWGKKLLEVRRPGFDKGRTALEFVRLNPDRTAVVIGDDNTDEDAFRALPDAVTVKVGDGESEARFRLSDVESVVSYLSRYLASQ